MTDLTKELSEAKSQIRFLEARRRKLILEERLKDLAYAYIAVKEEDRSTKHVNSIVREICMLEKTRELVKSCNKLISFVNPDYEIKEFYKGEEYGQVQEPE